MKSNDIIISYVFKLICLKRPDPSSSSVFWFKSCLLIFLVSSRNLLVYCESHIISIFSASIVCT